MLILKKMNRLIRGDVAFGFFCAGIFWLAVMGWATSFMPTTQEKEACYQAAKKASRDTGECKSFWEKTTSEPVALFTLVLAFSTVGLWIATIALYRSTKSQLVHAEGTAVRELRAYVYLRLEKRIYPPDAPHNRYAVHLSVINGGKSWARDVRLRKAIMVDKTGLQAPTKDLFDATELWTQETEPMVLGPGEQFDIQFGDIWFTELSDLETRKKVYYYVAWVTYEDALTNPPMLRQTQLCRMLGADTEGIGHISFAWMPTHNCVDEDCPQSPA
jgi:hypothetical protein